ncbi:MAG: sensor histidine kinase [Cyclobacteriaceae bacterium]|nr:sensor histidine kinase [Cyclobacteriaceae bacterium]
MMITKARSYLRIALHYAKSYSDNSWFPDVCNRAGMLMMAYWDLSKTPRPTKLDSSRYWHQKAISVGVTINRMGSVGWGYRGLLQNALFHPKKEIKDSIPYYFMKAAELAELTNDAELNFSCSALYIDYLTRIGNWTEADKVIASQIRGVLEMATFQKTTVYNNVHDYLARKNNLDTLSKLKELIIHGHNQLTAANHKDQLYAKDQQYEVTKTKKVLSATANKLAVTNKALIILIIASLLFLLLITYLFFLFRKNKKLSQRNELLLREQNHRVKNNLQMISSLLSLQSQKLMTSDAKAVLEDSQGRINSVALLHRMLYEGEQVGKIEVVSYIKSLTEEIKYSANRDVDIELTLPEKLELKIERVTSLGLIVNELFTNSMKHVSSEIPLSIRLQLKASNGKLSLTYSDNGAGVTCEVWMASNSFGNQLIQLQARQLQGDFTVTVDHGFNFALKIPA